MYLLHQTAATGATSADKLGANRTGQDATLQLSQLAMAIGCRVVDL
jgi:hypothetical protein